MKDVTAIITMHARWERRDVLQRLGSKFDQIIGKILDDRLERGEQARYTALERQKLYVKAAGTEYPPKPGTDCSTRLARWLSLIAYEQRRYDRADAYAHHARTLFAFEQAILDLYRSPEIWLQYIAYLTEATVVESRDGLRSRAITRAFDRALVALPDSELIVTLSAADQFEQTQDYAKADGLFESIIASGSALGWVEYLKYVNRRKGITAARALFETATAEEPTEGDPPRAPVSAWPGLFQTMAGLERAVGGATVAKELAVWSRGLATPAVSTDLFKQTAADAMLETKAAADFPDLSDSNPRVRAIFALRQRLERNRPMDEIRAVEATLDDSLVALIKRHSADPLLPCPPTLVEDVADHSMSDPAWHFGLPVTNYRRYYMALQTPPLKKGNLVRVDAGGHSAGDNSWRLTSGRDAAALLDTEQGSVVLRLIATLPNIKSAPQEIFARAHDVLDGFSGDVSTHVSRGSGGRRRKAMATHAGSYFVSKLFRNK
ncbi:hypothetical protein J8273_5707 [Carpediemonas membranifera]|uniref:Suppressor of forked domain-containing protein n=1 Tax=Carpediemonas membranifera TaxID=201153 RepID=A0A8J6AVX6_9EUKA|nr:hypothetical protein J8273_5707 [Carpediemonas membranifera]|eukprot:KAG9392895.1 hypothetical protein J8273_5707 [Carpediemonas membranifera]